MCDRALRAVVVAALLTIAGAASAQSLLDTQLRRRDQAFAAWKAEQDAVAELARQRRARPEDSLRSGGAVLLVPSGLGAYYGQAVVVMDSIIDRAPVGVGQLSPIRLRLHSEWTARPGADSLRVAWYLSRNEPPASEERIEWWWGAPTGRELGRALAAARRMRAAAALPPAFLSWLQGNPLADTSWAPWESTYRAMATSPTLVAQGCLQGQPSACRAVLGFDSAKDPLLEWVSPRGRREMARTLKSSVDYSMKENPADSARALWSACFDRTLDEACTTLIRMYAPNSVADIFKSGPGRQTLLLTALTTPGAPGFAAVAGRPYGAVQTLEAVSGTTLDKLLVRWSGRLNSARPERVELPPHRILAAVGWIILLGGLSFRSARWK